MRQLIKPNQYIDAVTPSEMEEMLASGQRRTMKYHREKGIIQLDGTGAGTKKIKVPTQYDWIFERVTCSAAAAGIVTLFENDPGSLVDLVETITIPASGQYSDAFSNRLWLPASATLVVVCSAGGANGNCTYNFQVRMEEHL